MELWQRLWNHKLCSLQDAILFVLVARSQPKSHHVSCEKVRKDTETLGQEMLGIKLLSLYLLNLRTTINSFSCQHIDTFRETKTTSIK